VKEGAAVIRTVVAFEANDNLIRVSDILEKGGIKVRYRCKTGQEAIRAIKYMGGGVVICGYKFSDMTASRLAFELSDTALVLVIARSQQLEYYDKEDIFSLSVPINGRELLGSVRMLIQLDNMKSRTVIPQRTEEENDLITKAKYQLMDHNNMTEAQAYKYIQNRSMETSLKMSETAKVILDAFENGEY